MNTTLDYLIIGAGPAGLQLGYYLEKAGRDYLILERGEGPGTFFQKFPRHRTLISSNKVYTGYDDPERRLRFDWNSLLSEEYAPLFSEYSKRYFAPADDMLRYLRGFAERYVHNVEYGAHVERISRNGSFAVTSSDDDTYHAARLIVATGNSKPYLPPIHGIELADVYTDVSVDPQDFVSQRVLIIGKGNSGFETGDNLVETASLIHLASPTPLKLAWSTHYPGDLRALNNNLLDTYQLKSGNALLDAAIEQIARTDDGRYRVSFAYSHAGNEVEDIIYDRVIVCTGFRFDDDIFDESCRPALTITDRFPDQTSAWESSNVKDLYFAGALTQVRDFKKTNSAFIHGFRYNARTLFHLLEQRYHGKELPSFEVEPTANGLVDAVIERINLSSALWQQYGFMGDALVVPDGSGPARYFPELPVDLIHESELGRTAHYYVITLEFGEHQPDPFNVQRDPDPERADKSVFLHPVIRYYTRGKEQASVHLLENLFGEWLTEEVHVQPLRRFFGAQLAASRKLLSAAGR